MTNSAMILPSQSTVFDGSDYGGNGFANPLVLLHDLCQKKRTYLTGSAGQPIFRLDLGKLLS